MLWFGWHLPQFLVIAAYRDSSPVQYVGMFLGLACGAVVLTHLALVRYRGRRTGRRYELPVQYARHADRVWILPAAPGCKTWWRNLRGGAAVDLVLAGHDRHGHATVIVPGQPEFTEGLTAYLTAHPSARRALGLPSHASPSPASPALPQISDGTCWSASPLMTSRRTAAVSQPADVVGDPDVAFGCAAG